MKDFILQILSSASHVFYGSPFSSVCVLLILSFSDFFFLDFPTIKFLVAQAGLTLFVQF